MKGFEVWYQHAHPRVLHGLVVVAGDPDLAREAAADAFTRALERWERIRGIENPEAWVHRVAVNVLRRRFRRRAIEERLLRRERPESVPPPHVPTDLWAAVAALPFRQRQAIALRYVLDLTQAQVADAMGVAPGTTAATLHAARRNLAALLGVDVTDDMEVWTHG
jgi:RNA polymerase sigma-70 factor (ECF subfamily)